jgi:glutamate racemase
VGPHFLYGQFVKIGILDSGIGGMTVANAIKNSLPQLSIVFFGDTAWFPYNDKTEKEVISRVLYACDILVNQNCTIIFLACNTASVLAYDFVKARLAGKAEVVNIVDLTIKALAEWPAIKHNLGIIGTVHTINSGVYENLIMDLDSSLNVTKLCVPKLATLAEQYCYSKYQCNLDLMYSYLRSPELKNIDTLLLACTHYSLLKEEIERFYEYKVAVLDGVNTTRTAFERLLQKAETYSSQESEYLVLCSKITQNFAQAAGLLLGKNIDLREV